MTLKPWHASKETLKRGPKQGTSRHPRLGSFSNLDVSENRGFSPQIIYFDRVFHYKPSILGYSIFWKQPNLGYPEATSFISFFKTSWQTSRWVGQNFDTQSVVHRPKEECHIMYILQYIGGIKTNPLIITILFIFFDWLVLFGLPITGRNRGPPVVFFAFINFTKARASLPSTYLGHKQIEANHQLSAVKGRYNLPRRFHDLSRNGWPLIGKQFSHETPNQFAEMASMNNIHSGPWSLVAWESRHQPGISCFLRVDGWLPTRTLWEIHRLQRLWFDRWPGVITWHQIWKATTETQRCNECWLYKRSEFAFFLAKKR